MSARIPTLWTAFLIIFLLVAGISCACIALLVLGPGPEIVAGIATSAARAEAPSPGPTATEPILPAPPTAATEPNAQETVEAPAGNDPRTASATPTAATAQAIVAGTADRVPLLTPAKASAPQTPSDSAQPQAPVENGTPPEGTEEPNPPAVEAPTATPGTGAPLQANLPLRARLGVCAAGRPVTRDVADELGFGWYLDWWAGPGRFTSADVEYMPMIRLKDGAIAPSGQELLDAIAANPGALWLIGNEPDVKWQDNVTAEVYAEAYHDLYELLKTQDPMSQVAFGGVSQPTPLRLQYLDRILEAYQSRYGEPIPVDVWNVHNFILREERDSWGVDIPPGMSEQTGMLREIDQHDDLDIFQEQLVAFRRWMAERGQQDKPLIVSEFGILMPNEYGFPPEQVEVFMIKTFEFLRLSSDPAIGYPADDHKLVQRWCWFSLADQRYPTGNLMDPETGELTPLGRAFGAYARSTD